MAVKSTSQCCWAALLLLWFGSFGNLWSQDEVVERVNVLHREIVVRVFDGGEPVYGLTRGDFNLKENGLPVSISSCREVRRALTPLRRFPKTAEEAAWAGPGKGRLFLFLLGWNEENPEWPRTWKYFLQNIYRPGDRVVLASDRRAVDLRNPREETKKREDFFRHMREELKQKHQERVQLFRELVNCVDTFHEAMMENTAKKPAFKSPETVLLNQFEGRYRAALESYRLRRLRAEPRMLQRLAAALRIVEAEKWVLVFLQNERLPLVHPQSRLMVQTPMSRNARERLKQFIDECDQRIRLAQDMAVQVRDLRSLFIGAGATFHLFLSDARKETLGTGQLRWMPVFSSWETAFRDIAGATGGRVQDSTRLEEALETAAVQADVHYVLTYKPRSASSRPNLEIGVNRPDLQVVFARRLKAREILPLQVSDPQWDGSTLRFQLSDYLRETVDAGPPEGDVHVKVRADGNGPEPLEFEKILHPRDEASEVRMDLHFPAPGDYILTVEARDRLSGNAARGYARARIAPPETPVEAPVDPRLRALLEKTASYCRRLQRAAFRFICTEMVEEMVLERNPLSRRVERERRHWRYDYQVVGEGEGTVSEQRRPFGGTGDGAQGQNVKLSTRFAAHYSVFMPVTLMGEQNRAAYRYRLQDSERLKGRTCAVVEVLPRREGEGPLAQGKVWVDVDDGSVLKIEIYPRGVRGSAALEAEVARMSARLDLKVTHWYLERRRGLRFPSSTEFSESYLFDKQVEMRRMEIPFPAETHEPQATIMKTPVLESRRRRVEFYRLTQEYRNYRYFEVDTRVEVGG